MTHLESGPSRLSARERASRMLLVGMTRLNRALGTVPRPARRDLQEARILSGDLRGRYLALRGTQIGVAMVLGTFERWVADAMHRYVRPGSVAYDIGASYGYHTLRLSRLVGPSGRVIAFEPDPTDRDILQRNVRANHLGNVAVSAVALSDANGHQRFATFSYPGVSHIAREDTPEDARIVEVETRTLDDLVYQDDQPAPDFVKIDVEGGELGVLLGAQRVLDEAGPTIVCEVRKGELWTRITELMLQHGYAARVLYETADLGDVAFVKSARGTSGA